MKYRAAVVFYANSAQISAITAIAFDRFPVMQMYSKVRCSKVRKADEEGQARLKGSTYLLLKNRDQLGEDQHRIHAQGVAAGDLARSTVRRGHACAY
ncbi:MAG: transposase [Betaproteobacteria bacterium]|nr:transposase [Betaproteobacteria bacterium]